MGEKNHMFLKRHFVILLMLLVIYSDNVLAQTTLSVMNNPLEEIVRRKQLTSDTSGYNLSGVSFMVRPVELQQHNQKNKKFEFTVLPLQYIQQFNSHRPLNYADGSMFPARGWQFNYSAGVKLAYKGFTAQLRPEYNWAFNDAFPTFPTDHFNILWRFQYEWINKIDLPERFKDEPIRKFFTGQSKLQYAYKGIAIGVSTENLWWGPGRFNALLMSNNAPGFLHYTFHSERPLKTAIGSFEWQIISGSLKASGTDPLEPMRSVDGRFLYEPKNINGDRVLTGGVFTWQPKLLKGVYLGADLMAIRYKNSAKRQTSKMGSLFARLVLPNDHAEVYLQYGRSDKFASPLNIFRNGIPRGYLAGVRKMFPLHASKAKDDYVQIGVEIIQLQAPNLNLINNAQSWYTDSTVRHGFTNLGQVLGASVGPGGNAQRLEVSWVKKEARIGLEFERFLHNPDFYYRYNYNSGSRDFNRQWVDLMASLVFNIPFKNLQLFGQFSYVRSINYQWKALIPSEIDYLNYFDNGWDEINLHGRLGLQFFVNR